jgi:(S)-citramalyl-CoA lyase
LEKFLISPLRTLLFTPATRPERFAKAAQVGADVLIIDLEDAVAPRDKSRARDNVIAALPELATSSAACAIRINGLDTRAGLADLMALLESAVQPKILILPKIDAASKVSMVDRLLSESASDTKLIGLIESAAGIKRIDDIANATPRLCALMLGAADLAADYGCGAQAFTLEIARVHLVQACALAGIAPIDSPFFAIDDIDGLHQEAERAVDMGFAGKAAIHPNQIQVIGMAFTPTPESIDRARVVLSVMEKGVGTVDGKMVDEAMARWARRVLVHLAE